MTKIDILRQHYFPRIEIIGRDRKISGYHTKGYSCLMGDNKGYHLNYIVDHVLPWISGPLKLLDSFLLF